MTTEMMTEPAEQSGKSFTEQRAALAAAFSENGEKMKLERLRLVREYANEINVPSFEQMVAHNLSQEELDEQRSTLLFRRQQRERLDAGEIGTKQMADAHKAIRLRAQEEDVRRQTWESEQNALNAKYNDGQTMLMQSANAHHELMDSCSQSLKDEWKATQERQQQVGLEIIDLESALVLKRNSLHERETELRQAEHYMTGIRSQESREAKTMSSDLAHMRTTVDRVKSDIANLETNLTALRNESNRFESEFGRIKSLMLDPESI